MTAKPHPPTVTARQLVGLLREKHAGDFFVSECKDGPTWGGSHRRLDAWALPKTWSPLNSIGYEVKVSRGDWLHDTKWPDYLNLCHSFYVVAPSGVVRPEELPPEVGLLVTTTNATRLLTKRKAQHRAIDVDPYILWYILICRAQACPPRSHGLDYNRWAGRTMTEALAAGDLGRAMHASNSKRLRALYDEHVVKVQRENSDLRAENKGLADLKRLAEALNISPHYVTEYTIRRRIEETSAPRTISALEQARNVARDAAKSFDRAILEVQDLIRLPHTPSPTTPSDSGTDLSTP